jgi:tetratricopeptide (TPR) repeat protein
LTRLEHPNQHRAGGISFSPDGTQLATVGEDRLFIDNWDLRAIGRQLAELGLPWDLPPFPPTPDDPAPLRVKVLRGDRKEDFRRELEKCDRALAQEPEKADLYEQRGLTYYRLSDFRRAEQDFSQALKGRPKAAHLYFYRGLSHERLKDYARAVADFETVLKLAPDHQRASNSLAWIYVTGPAELRAPDKALPLAQKAVRLAPTDANYLNTLGVVYYRLGQLDGAVETLERSLPKSKIPASDLFFLAMSYRRLGQTARAADCYDRAVHWVDAQPTALAPDQVEELNAFRAEAEALLKKQAKP